jgi:hypothetical protein
METSYLRWNVPNWITVVLMVAVMTALAGFVTNLIKQKKGAANG